MNLGRRPEGCDVGWDQDDNIFVSDGYCQLTRREVRRYDTTRQSTRLLGLFLGLRLTPGCPVALHPGRDGGALLRGHCRSAATGSRGTCGWSLRLRSRLPATTPTGGRRGGGLPFKHRDGPVDSLQVSAKRPCFCSKQLKRLVL